MKSPSIGLRAHDTPYMELALRLARKAQGMTSPNPLVGAVIVDRAGTVIGTGFHKKAGGPHAEVMALRDAGRIPSGSTMVVSLEPCNHFGRTPPCTRAIKQSGIKRVVIAARDPNPGVKGNGAAYLRHAGIEVIEGVCERDALRLNEAYLKHVTTSLPFVSLKLAMSMDGRIAARDGTSQWITSEASRKAAHTLRNIVDAVIVGVGTIKKDDPELTVRHVRVRQRPLWRVIFDTHLTTPLDAKVIANQDDTYRTMILTASTDDALIRAFTDRGVVVVLIEKKESQSEKICMLSINNALKFLGKRFMHVLVEGGAGLAGSMLRARRVDKLHIFIAPKIIGEDGLYPFKGVALKTMKHAIGLTEVGISKYGTDCLVECYPEW